MSVLIYVLMIALWRIRGTSLGAYSGLEPKKKRKEELVVSRHDLRAGQDVAQVPLVLAKQCHHEQHP